MSVIEAEKVVKSKEEVSTNDIFSDIKYICGSTSLIVESLQKGLDIAQLPSGDVIVTEVRTVNTHYSWNKNKQRMIKISQTQ
jgi:hypothetical protein